MPVRIALEDAGSLVSYADVDIAFTSIGRAVIEEHAVVRVIPHAPFVKDYDALESPASLPERLDVRTWGFLVAWDAEQRVGGAILAWNTPGVDMLEGRDDLAVVWDLRVASSRRGAGVGTALWRAAEAWARERGCTRLRAETQDINPDACRFYAAQGCEIVHVDPTAYPALPDETQLIWERGLLPGPIDER